MYKVQNSCCLWQFHSTVQLRSNAIHSSFIQLQLIARPIFKAVSFNSSTYCHLLQFQWFNLLLYAPMVPITVSFNSLTYCYL